MGALAAVSHRCVRWGTAGGAKVLGLPAVGTLEVGQAADIAVYSLAHDPRYFGLHDPAIGPVASGGAAHLKTLLVAGREVVRDGAIAGLDLAALGREARTAVAKIIAAVA